MFDFFCNSEQKLLKNNMLDLIVFKEKKLPNVVLRLVLCEKTNVCAHFNWCLFSNTILAILENLEYLYFNQNVVGIS